GSGSKLYEGDLRTPTGLYMIVDKRRHARWDHFLLLDYPNLQDLHRYWLAMEAGTLPRRGDGYAGVGGAVGIHGTDKPGLNRCGGIRRSSDARRARTPHAALASPAAARQSRVVLFLHARVWLRPET